MRDVLIRPWSPSDLPACLAVLRSNMPDFVLPAEADDFVAFLDRGESRYVVVEHTGAVVACGGLAVADTAGVATLCWGLVRRDLHGVGLGTRLVLERVGWVVDDARIEVVALDTSPRTAGFFARFGFRPISTTRDGYGPGLDRIDMELSLDASRRDMLRRSATAAS